MPLHLLTEERFLAQQPITNQEGDLGFIVMANIDIPADPCLCYLKFYPPSQPRAIINECAGYILAETLGYSVPKYGGMITVPKRFIAGAPDWMPEDEAIGWFSADTSHPSIKRSVNWVPGAGPARNKRYTERAARILADYPEITQKIIALDELIANPDRNIGNLLVEAGGLELIDHGSIFGTTSWDPATLPSNFAMEITNKLWIILGNDADKLPYKKAIILAYTRLVDAIPDALKELQKELSSVFEPTEIQAINDFLVARTGWIDMPKKVGLLV